ncbi:MAG TPA: F0F1 ATP synthase subunit B [Acidimicrobiales bacterium]|nr:F0F1 ATP synthase subunit B [Acidimicrobiales bacterium]
MILATNNFLVPNATFIVELFIFLVVLGILAKYVLPFLNRTIDARQQLITQSINDAEEARRRAEELEAQRRAALEQSREEARVMKEEASRVGEQLRQELARKGEEEYQRLVARATADIEASARRAAQELRSQVAGLVSEVVERVLGEGISLPDQQRIIDNAIAEVEAQAQGALAAPGAGR